MMGTIIPIVYRERSRGRQLRVIADHVLGYMIGAGLFGLLLGSVGVLLFRNQGPMSQLVVGLSAAIACLHESKFVRLQLPQFKKQVPHEWRLLYTPRVAAFAYGFGLGPGIGTFIPVATFYVILIAALCNGNVIIALIIMEVYALSRAMPIVIASLLAADANDTLEKVVQPVLPYKRVMHGINASVLAMGAFLLTIVFFSR